MLICIHCYSLYDPTCMDQLGLHSKALPCFSKNCKGTLTVMRIDDEFIAPAILQLIIKGHKPLEWNSGLYGKPYLYVAFGSDMQQKFCAHPLPHEFRFSDSSIDLKNKFYLVTDGKYEVLFAKIPLYQSEKERVKHVTRLNRLFLNWVEEANNHDELDTNDVNWRKET
jgi:hypothetical protein